MQGMHSQLFHFLKLIRSISNCFWVIITNHKNIQTMAFTEKFSWRSRKVCRLNFSKIVGNAIWLNRSPMTKLNTFKKIIENLIFPSSLLGEVHIIIASPQAIYAILMQYWLIVVEWTCFLYRPRDCWIHSRTWWSNTELLLMEVPSGDHQLSLVP